MARASVSARARPMSKSQVMAASSRLKTAPPAPTSQGVLWSSCDSNTALLPARSSNCRPPIRRILVG